MVAGPKRLGEASDRALPLVGFAGIFRRSDFEALEVEDLRFASAATSNCTTRGHFKLYQSGLG